MGEYFQSRPLSEKLKSRKFWLVVLTTIGLFFLSYTGKLDNTTFGVLMGFIINGYLLANYKQKESGNG